MKNINILINVNLDNRIQGPDLIMEDDNLHYIIRNMVYNKIDRIVWTRLRSPILNLLESKTES